LQLCYVDESGTAQTLLATDPEQQPVIVIAGISLPEQSLTAITHEWIDLKTRFYPTIAATGHGWLDAILQDIKGNKVRARFRARATSRQKQHSVGLVDMPVFGHSDNHAGLQIADLLCSAVLAPTACAVYAGAYAGWNQHCDPGYIAIRERFGQRLQALTFTWPYPRTGKPSSSVLVSDPVGRHGTRLMWGP
jgi:hypothetical protein